MTQRQDIIERLNGLELEGGSHEMLSAICKAVLPHGGAWTLRMCEDLRDRLVRLLGEADTVPSDERITDELRHNIEGAEQLYGCECKRLTEIADRIDAEHEAKVSYWQGASYKDGYDEGFASADDWLAQHEDAMAEHGWVRKDKEHIISHATIEVTPYIDWSRMADELNEFVEIVRGIAGGAE